MWTLLENGSCGFSSSGQPAVLPLSAQIIGRLTVSWGDAVLHGLMTHLSEWISLPPTSPNPLGLGFCTHWLSQWTLCCAANNAFFSSSPAPAAPSKGYKLYSVSRAWPRPWDALTGGEVGRGRTPWVKSSYCWTQGKAAAPQCPQAKHRERNSGHSSHLLSTCWLRGDTERTHTHDLTDVCVGHIIDACASTKAFSMQQ